MFASEDALTGLGMEPHRADVIGAQPVAQNGHGTTQIGATIILSQSSELVASGGNTAFILQDLGINVPFNLAVSSSTSAVIFCPVGHTLNGTLNGSVTILQWKSCTAWQYKKGFWVSNTSP